MGTVSDRIQQMRPFPERHSRLDSCLAVCALRDVLLLRPTTLMAALVQHYDQPLTAEEFPAALTLLALEIRRQNPNFVRYTMVSIDRVLAERTPLTTGDSLNRWVARVRHAISEMAGPYVELDLCELQTRWKNRLTDTETTGLPRVVPEPSSPQ